MVWIRAQCSDSTLVQADLDSVRRLLLDITGCGRLMPSVITLQDCGGGVYHYQLDSFSNGAISMAPDYQAKFDASDPGAIRWEPHGEHNFRSWGVYRSSPGPVPGETVVEIDVRTEADVPIDRMLIPLVEPFARQFMREVTSGFLVNIKAAAEGSARAPGGTSTGSGNASAKPTGTGSPAASGLQRGGGR